MALPTGVLYGICLVAPALVLAAADKAARVMMSPRTAKVPPGVSRPRRPLERLVADLQRLDAELMVLQGSQTYARHHHRESTQLAYDDVLLDCARVLEVRPPPTPLSESSRRRLEIELQQAGLRW